MPSFKQSQCGVRHAPGPEFTRDAKPNTACATLAIPLQGTTAVSYSPGPLVSKHALQMGLEEMIRRLHCRLVWVRSRPCDAPGSKRKRQMQNLPVLLHIDGTIVVIVVVGVGVRLVTSIVVRRRVHVGIVTSCSRLLP